MVMRLIVSGILLVLLGRLTWVQVVKAHEITLKAEEIRLSRVELKPMRGAILDRKGLTLAVSVPRSAAVANTLQMKDFAAAALKLAPALGIPAGEIQATLEKQRGSGWVPLVRGLNQEQAGEIRKLKVEGISLVPETERYYPQRTSANQVIGYIDGEGKGKYGLEAFYDKELRGEPGHVRAEVLPTNTPIEDTIKELVLSKPGLDLMLTLDINLQRRIEDRLDQVIKEQDARRAAVLVMDVHTGEILVMAMRPGADPGDRKTWYGAGNKVDYGKINNWTLDPMAPGSIFKAVTTAIALEEKAITLTDTFLDEGFIKLPGATIYNWDQVVRPQPEPRTIAELMAVSSNVGLIKVGQKIPRPTFVKYLKGFGFMDPTGIDFPRDSAANFGVTKFEEKYDVDWANMYIGQHLEVTPLQMLAAVSAIANGGYLVQPHLVREVRDSDGKVVRATPSTQRRQVISEQTATEVRDVMVHVVESAPAKPARPDHYTVGGKTGTVQKFDPKTGKIAERGTADFVGFAPANNPRVAMMVIVDDPRPPGYGGVIAAPLFKEFMPWVMQSLQILPNTREAEGQGTAPKVESGVVPDLMHLPAAWAQERLIRAGFTPKLNGSGPVVTAQSLKPGATAKAGSTVELTLAPADPKLAEQLYVPDFTGLSLAEASQLARELHLTIKPSGAGFVTRQEPAAGRLAPARSALGVTLAPRQR